MKALDERQPSVTVEDGFETFPIDFRRIHPDRVRDPLRTQNNILEVATKLFAEHGLSGARIDQISELTQTSKRMIYYYFGSKEGLYEAVLERAYLHKWQADDSIDVVALGAMEGLCHITGYVFDNLNRHPTFARLVSAENINRGRFLPNLRRLKDRIPPVVRELQRVVQRGIAEGLFREDTDYWDLYWLISACCVYGVVGRYTFEFLLDGRSSTSAEDRHRAVTIEAVRCWVCGAPA